MQRIFVSGGGGFIGRNTVPVLLANGNAVVGLQRRNALVPLSHPALTVVHGDLTEESPNWKSCLAECDTLLHLAGDTTPSLSATNFDLELRVSLTPFLNLLRMCQNTAIKRIVVLSSGGTVYGQPQSTPIDENHPTIPTTPYGLSKLTIEHITRLWATQNRVEYILLRASNPYGPYQFGRNDQGVIGVWLLNILRGEPLVVWGNGRTIRDYLYVGDLANALTIACTQVRLASGIYNIGSGCGHQLLDIVKTIVNVTRTQPQVNYTPGRTYDVAVNILSPQRFEESTGWKAQVSLTKGIELTFEFLKKTEQ